MIDLVHEISEIAKKCCASFHYKRRGELNNDINELGVLPLIALLEIETPGFVPDSRGFMREVYPLNIQFITKFEKDIDSVADQRIIGHYDAYYLAKVFLSHLYQTNLFQDFPQRIPGVIINKAYNVTALGYEINLTLIPNEPMGLCL